MDGMKLPTPPVAALLLAMFSAAALAAALIGQYGFNLHPCHLCLIQRIPFAVVILFGLVGFFAKRIATWMVGLSGLALLINSGIALYHSGVERKWWAGLEGCSAPDMSGSVEDLMTRIQNAATVNCTDIQWEFLGLSMANYNVAMCAVAGIACGLYLLKLGRQTPS